MGTYNAYRTTRQRRGPLLLAILLFAFFVYFMTRRSALECTSKMEHQQQITVYTRIIQDFVRRFEEYGVDYMIFGSTLLGSFRHHGLIPYDDNIIHFVVNRSHVETVRAFLLETNYSSGAFNFTSFEVEDDAISLCPLPAIGPTIRISNFEHEGPSRLRFSGLNHTLALTSVFPLTVRPFESLLLPSPACPSVLLGRLYNLNLCCRIHVHEKPSHCKPCLHYTNTPFVERHRYTDHVMLEQLWLGDRAIGTARLLSEGLCSVP